MTAPTDLVTGAMAETQPGPRLPLLGKHIELVRDVVILTVFATFVRLPYFTQTVISWDESSYILNGQCVLDGHLPQTVVSGLKPPLAYVPYALFILLFGQSIAAIRLGGLVCVLAASVIVYLACRRRLGAIGALMAGITVSVLATTDVKSGCTMGEHIALVPLSLVALIWPGSSLTGRRSFCVGLLIGLAGALKTNLAAFLLAPLFLIFSQLPSRGLTQTLRLALLLILGSILPILAPVPVYWLSGNFDLLWQSSVIAACNYAWHNTSRLPALVPSLIRRMSLINPAGFFIAWIVPLLALIAALRSAGRSVEAKRFVLVMATFVASGLLTTLAPGMIHVRHHYLVLAPFLAAMSGYVLQLGLSSKFRLAVGLASLCIFALSLSPVYSAYGVAWRTVVEKQQTDTAYKVVHYLRSRNVRGQYVYFRIFHIGHWLTGARIPTRFVHPSDIGKPFLLTSLYTRSTSTIGELQHVFQKRPVYVVSTLNENQFPKNKAAARLFDNELETNYDLEKVIDGIGIFRRRVNQ